MLRILYSKLQVKFIRNQFYVQFSTLEFPPKNINYHKWYGPTKDDDFHRVNI